MFAFTLNRFINDIQRLNELSLQCYESLLHEIQGLKYINIDDKMQIPGLVQNDDPQLIDVIKRKYLDFPDKTKKLRISNITE